LEESDEPVEIKKAPVSPRADPPEVSDNDPLDESLPTTDDEEIATEPLEPNRLAPLRTDTEPLSPDAERPPSSDSEPPADDPNKESPPKSRSDPPAPPPDDTPPPIDAEPPAETPEESPATSFNEPPDPTEPAPPETVTAPPTGPLPPPTVNSPPDVSFRDDEDDPAAMCNAAPVVTPAPAFTDIDPADPAPLEPLPIVTEPVLAVEDSPLSTDTLPELTS
jgi:hypothetical protein